jgi:hypothetical protein
MEWTRVTLMHACAISVAMVWAAFVLEIVKQRRGTPPMTRPISFALSLIAGMTVGVLLSLLVA